MSSSSMRIRVDYNAIRRNVSKIRQTVGCDDNGVPIQIFACLKANAYGFGVVPVAKALAEVVDGFQLGNLDDAIRVLEVAPDKPVLLLATTVPSEVVTIAESGLIATVYSQAVVDVCAKHPRPLDLAIKVNAGLERLGIAPDDLAKTAKTLIAAGHKIRGIYTHVPFRGKEAESWARACMRRFEAAVQDARQVQGMPKDVFVQARASSWVGRNMNANDNAVSIGHLLFGFTSSHVDYSLADLECPLLSLSTKVLQTHTTTSKAQFYKGSYFSGGMPSKVAIATGGLANGLTPYGERRFDVLVNGSRRPLAGISLENLIIDISEGPEVNIGDEVIVCTGSGSKGSLSLKALAQAQNMSEPQFAFFLSKMNTIEAA